MRKILNLLICGFLFVGLVACATNPDDSPSNKDDDTSSEVDETSYQGILDEYTKKMEEITPSLVESFKIEANASDRLDVTLANISTEKVTELADILTQGTSKMSELMYKNGDSYEIYQKWSMKLSSNYSECAKKITDEYIAMVTGL